MAVVASGTMTVDPDLKSFESNLSKSFGASAKKAAVAFGGAFAAQKAVDFLGSSIGEARESQKVMAQTAAVIKSTGGAAGVSAKQVDALATSLSNKTGIDDEAIAKASNLLLTFTNIKDVAGDNNDIFSQATKITTDMGAALGTDASGAAIQLGKALNDPVKGISALTRVGVTFSAEQKKQIENFVATGRVADAQKVILKELSKEFGGSAEAQATAGDKAKVAFDNLKESIGTKLLPVLDKFLGVVTAFLQDGDKMRALLVALAIPVGVLVAGFIAANLPIIAVTAAVGALVFAFSKMLPLLKSGFNSLKEVATGVAGAISKAFKSVFNSIAKVWNSTIGKLSFKVPSWVPGLGGKGFNVPDIPVLHSGGVYQAPFGQGGQGLALLRNGETVLTPGQMSNMGGINVVVNLNGNVSEGQAYAAGQAAGRGIEDEMARTALRRAARAR